MDQSIGSSVFASAIEPFCITQCILRVPWLDYLQHGPYQGHDVGTKQPKLCWWEKQGDALCTGCECPRGIQINQTIQVFTSKKTI